MEEKDVHSLLVSLMGHCCERRKNMTSWKGEEGRSTVEIVIPSFLEDKGAFVFCKRLNSFLRKVFRTAVLDLQ